MHLKKDFDRRYPGPPKWNVIVGQNFGCAIDYQEGYYTYFHISDATQPFAVLLFGFLTPKKNKKTKSVDAEEEQCD